MIVFRRAQPLPVTLRHLALDSTYGAWASQCCGLGPIEGRSTALHCTTSWQLPPAAWVMLHPESA